MKCPKCQYISFESGDRCRNCGYEFSLASDAPAIDLPIQDADAPVGPLADLSLKTLEPLPAGRSSSADPDPPAAAPITSSLDLPLFGRPTRDAPLAPPNVPPRAPLAVRRAAPPTPRPRPRREGPAAAEEPQLALDAEALFPTEPPRSAAREILRPPAARTLDRPQLAPSRARALAAAIDLLLTAAIDAAVLYFTLRLCGLSFASTLALPIVPLVAFLVLLNGGYFASFVAASGQTIGKMAAGIRVIPADPDATARARVPFGQAVARAAAYVVSVVPAGLGLLPAFLTPDRRALHDRLADTRVVKA